MNSFKISDGIESEDSVELSSDPYHTKNEILSLVDQQCSNFNSQTELITNQYDIDFPIVNKKGDIIYDVKMGWKPEEQELSGAPIPLMYNFDQIQVKEYDQETGLPIEPLYLGPRWPTSTQMHKSFANLERATGCE